MINNELGGVCVVAYFLNYHSVDSELYNHLFISWDVLIPEKQKPLNNHNLLFNKGVSYAKSNHIK